MQVLSIPPGSWEGRELSFSSENLDPVKTDQSLRSLVSMTSGPSALEHILQREDMSQPPPPSPANLSQQCMSALGLLRP